LYPLTFSQHRRATVQVTFPFAVFILPSCTESLNLSRGSLYVQSCGWHERSLGAGGVPRGDSARAVPQRGTEGKPFVPAATLNAAASSLSCLPLALSLPAGGPDCPSGGVGQPSPLSRLGFITSSVRRNQGAKERAAGHYLDSLAKLFRIVRFGIVGRKLGRGRDDF